MDFSCPNCKLTGHIDDARVPEQGIYATCLKCREQFPVKKEPPRKAYLSSGTAVLTARSTANQPLGRDTEDAYLEEIDHLRHRISEKPQAGSVRQEPSSVVRYGSSILACNLTSEVSDNFITQTYGFFFLSITGMFVCGLIGFFLLPRSLFIPFTVADSILWILCGWFGWRNPIEIVFPLFTIVTGCLLGLTTGHYAKAGAAHVMLSAGIMTVIMFASLSVYVYFTKKDFSYLSGFPAAGFWILLGGFLLLAFVHMTAIHVGLCVFGSLVFLAWILFDTSRIVGRWDADLTPAIGAFELFLDIIGLYSYIRGLFDIAEER